jgi:hypothetical protein
VLAGLGNMVTLRKSSKKFANKRNPVQRENDLATISSMYLQGYQQREIAAHLGLSQQQISYDLKQIRNQWLESQLRDYDAAMNFELAKLDKISQEYWKVYERSLQADGIGDVRALAGLADCVKKRCRILGLDAPTRIEAAAKSEGFGNAFAQAIKDVEQDVQNNRQQHQAIGKVAPVTIAHSA